MTDATVLTPGLAAYLQPTQRAVIARWRRGFDTLAIGQHYGIPEADVCRILAHNQDRRREIKLARARNALGRQITDGRAAATAVSAPA